MLDDVKADSTRTLSGISSLEALYPVLKREGMGPGWNKPEPSLWPSPRKTLVPAHWSYRTAKAALDVAGRLIGTDLAERRNLILTNPAEGNAYGTSRALVAAYQMVKAHETARSHRHSPNALRLIVDAGPDTFTIVQGEKIRMLPGDVVLTPNWCWHGHANEGDVSAYWIDVLDAPLVQLLEPMFLEYPKDGVENPRGDAHRSPVVFPLAETMARLDAADGPEVELGAPALDTIALHVRRLEPGEATPALRTTASNIYAVIDGEGQSIIDGQVFAWTRGDVFVAPSWREHSHRAQGGRAHLLRVTDEPVMHKLGWLRTPG